MEVSLTNGTKEVAEVSNQSVKNSSNDDVSTRMSHLSKKAMVDIEFNDLTCSVPSLQKDDSKLILKGINGQFKSNELTAVMGPSGAGKSTLLNILAGYTYTNIGGSITINGLPRNIRKFKKMECYIMQENLLQPNLTIFEAMSFAADLKLGKEVPKAKKLLIIEEILSTLRLSKVRNTFTERLSGGETKRLLIALELVNNPPVIFLDEPTTGLDELASIQCIELLQSLAHFGRTIVCSIHTPSAKIFQKFDHVYILAAGQCIYRGTPQNLVPYLYNIGLDCPKHYNPADFIIEIASGDYGLEPLERMINTADRKLPILPIFRSISEQEIVTENSNVLWIDQFSTLSKRMILQIYRNKSNIYLKICMHIFLALVNGGLFWNMGDDGSKTLFNFCFCFACLIVFLYIPMLPVLLQFPTEVILMKREYFNGWYKFSPYYWAMIIASIPLQISLVFIYSSLAYIMTGQPLELDRFLMFLNTCFLCAFIAENIARSIASVLNIVNSVFMGPVITCPLMLLAVLDFGDPSPRSLFRNFLIYMSYLRHALEALMAAVYGFERKKLACSEVYCHYSAPLEIFHSLGLEKPPNFWLRTLVLITILCTCKIIVFYVMRQTIRSNKTFQMLQMVRLFVKKYIKL